MSCELDELSKDSAFPFLTTTAIRSRLEESFKVASLKKYTKQIQDYSMDKLQTTTTTSPTKKNTLPPIVATSTCAGTLTVATLSTSVGSLTEATPSTSVVTHTIIDEIQQDALNLDDLEEVRIYYY